MPKIRPMIIIAIWCGSFSKPTDSNEFLKPFTTELKNLMNVGMDINGHHISVIFFCCICDAPARAYIKGTVNFNHTLGCQKCMVRGIYSKEANRMYFPQNVWPLRTEADFRAKNDIEHHKETSPLEELEIDMVTCFPASDPLHLLELGIMKKYEKRI